MRKRRFCGWGKQIAAAFIRGLGVRARFESVAGQGRGTNSHSSPSGESSAEGTRASWAEEETGVQAGEDNGGPQRPEKGTAVREGSWAVGH